MFMFVHVMPGDSTKTASKTSNVFKKVRNTRGCISRQIKINKPERFLQNDDALGHQFKIKYKQKSKKCQV